MQPAPNGKGMGTFGGWNQGPKKRNKNGRPMLVVDPAPDQKNMKLDMQAPGNMSRIQPLGPRSNGGIIGAGGKRVNKVYKTY